jgi:hypothetical protein
MRSSL